MAGPNTYRRQPEEKPNGFEHNPMDIKRVGKPLLFMPPLLSPYFNGYYQTGYMQMIGHEKID
jgi:hypothetical protein